MLSRTDSIGDVVLTLPMAGFIKMAFPQCKLFFLGRTYTRDIIHLSEFVDGFINYLDIEKKDEQAQVAALREIKADVFLHVFPSRAIAKLAKKAGIKLRVGTTNRLYHWFYCNKLVPLSRKGSDLHEAQLNIKLLQFLEINTEIPLKEIPRYYGFTKTPSLNSEYKNWIDHHRFNLILHPKSKGSAKEWGLDNFEKLIELLPRDEFNIFISGTQQDGDQMKTFLAKVGSKVTDITGKLSLQEFIAFINECQGLVAASTGPLHIAASLNKKALGLFSPKRPIHPGRWAPLGDHAQALVYDKGCEKCDKGEDCDCITKISPQQIVDLLRK